MQFGGYTLPLQTRRASAARHAISRRVFFCPRGVSVKYEKPPLTLNTVRNICAHHSRLWNRELAVKPELPTAWKTSGIGNERFYSIALIIQTLLTDPLPDSQWGEQLKALFNAHPTVNLRAMQFPADWQTLTPWN